MARSSAPVSLVAERRNVPIADTAFPALPDGLRDDRVVGANADRPWWRNPGGRPPWVKPRIAPPWLLPVLFVPLSLGGPIGAGFGVAAAAVWCVLCLAVATVGLLALPKAVVAEEEGRSLSGGWPRDERSRRQFRTWTVVTLVAIMLIQLATWWLR